MTTKEKLRAFNSLQDAKYMFADIALLKKKNPNSEALQVQAAANRKNGEILYALLDEVSVDEIKANRVKLTKALEEKNSKDAEAARIATEKADKEAKELKEKEEKEILDIHKYLKDNKVEFSVKLGLKKLKALKEKTEKTIEASITPEERKKLADKEAGKIRDYLTVCKVPFNKQLGLKKLRALKEKTEKKILKEENVEADEIKAYLAKNNISFAAGATLAELQALKIITAEALKKDSEAEIDPDLDEKKDETNTAPSSGGDEGDSAEKKN